MEFLINQTIDLRYVNAVHRYEQPLEYGDAGAHKWVVSIRDGRKVADLSGMTAKCFFARAASAAEKQQGASKVTLILDAQVDAQKGMVSCMLDEACYNGVGSAAAVMRVYNASGQAMAAARMTAMLECNTSGSYYDPDGLIPSVDDIIVQYEKMQQVTERTEAAAKKAEALAINASGYAGDSNKLGGHLPSYYATAEDVTQLKENIVSVNLLDNSNFMHPITSRGEAILNDPYAYYRLDYWSQNTLSTRLEMTSNGVKVINTNAPNGAFSLQQVVYRPDRFINVPLTLAIKVTGVSSTDGIYNHAFVGAINGVRVYTAVIRTAGIYIAVLPPQSTLDELYVVLRQNGASESGTNTTTIEWIALYEGEYTAETLPPYVPRSYSNGILAYHPGRYTYRKNYAVNSDLTNPVNQRGKTKYGGDDNTEVTMRTIDMWAISKKDAQKSYMTVDGDGCTFFAVGGIAYPQHRTFIPDNLRGKKVTAAVCLGDDRVRIFGGGEVLASAPDETKLLNRRIKLNDGVEIGLYHHTKDNLVIQLHISAGSSQKIKWIALYEGEYTAETLPTDVTKGYAAELMECRRFFRQYSIVQFPLTCETAGWARIGVDYTGMIKTPSVAAYALKGVYANNAVYESISSVSAVALPESELKAVVTGLQVNSAGTIRFKSLALSSEL